VVKSNQSVPVLQCHGDADHLVSHELGKMASQVIGSFNDRLQFKSYSGLGHWYCPQVLYSECNDAVVVRALNSRSGDHRFGSGHYTFMQRLWASDDDDMCMKP